MAEKKIGDATYRVEAMLAFDALKLQARLMKVIGKALPELPAILAGIRKRDDPAIAEKADAAAIAAIGGIFNTDSNEIAGLVRDIVQSAEIRQANGQYTTVDLDRDFTGHLQDIVPVVVFVLQVNFSDFFTALLAVGGRK